jgi:transposase
MVFMGGTLRLSGREGFSNPDRLAELFLALPERTAKSVSRPRVSPPTTAMANACRGGCCIKVGPSGAVNTISGWRRTSSRAIAIRSCCCPRACATGCPKGHLAWFVIDAVAQLDLGAFYGAYRADGHGRPAHDPAMMVALLLYGYAIGERSSRRLERRCVEDVATRVICANQAPDHTTIARFRQRHEAALAGLFGEVLALCAESGLVRVGGIAVDGTKLAANAAPQATRDYEQIAREILAEADAVDAEEDERFGGERGDELPPELSTAQGRRGWLREAKRRLDAKRAEEARPIARDRPDRLREAKRRLEEEHRTECRANAAYEAYRARGVDKNGKRFGRPPQPFTPPPTPTAKINLSDLDSRNVKTSRGWVQGYNAQAVCTEDQIVIAAEVTVDSPDFGHLEPMIRAACDELRRAGVEDPPDVVLADAGYWHQTQMERLVGDGLKGGDPTGRQETRGHPTGLGRRPLRVHATRP